jgi:hypothetical protein
MGSEVKSLKRTGHIAWRRVGTHIRSLWKQRKDREKNGIRKYRRIILKASYKYRMIWIDRNDLTQYRD